MAAMANPISTGRAGRACGFTYLGLLILLAIMGLVAAAGIKMGAVMQRAAAEEELLEIGAQFSEALRSYAAATPRDQVPYPPSLQELLKDPRFPHPRRHLRKIFLDPVSGNAQWGITYLDGERGVIAVYSLSDRRPLKIANFDVRFQNFGQKEKLSDWKFVAAGSSVPVLPAAPKPQPSLFGEAANAVVAPPASVPVEPAPQADDQAMELAPGEDKDEATETDEKNKVTPSDDGRVDETRKVDPKDSDRDPRVPVKPPVKRP